MHRFFFSVTLSAYRTMEHGAGCRHELTPWRADGHGYCRRRLMTSRISSAEDSSVMRTVGTEQPMVATEITGIIEDRGNHTTDPRKDFLAVEAHPFPAYRRQLRARNG